MTAYPSILLKKGQVKLEKRPGLLPVSPHKPLVHLHDRLHHPRVHPRASTRPANAAENVRKTFLRPFVFAKRVQHGTRVHLFHDRISITRWPGIYKDTVPGWRGEHDPGGITVPFFSLYQQMPSACMYDGAGETILIRPVPSRE